MAAMVQFIYPKYSKHFSKIADIYSMDRLLYLSIKNVKRLFEFLSYLGYIILTMVWQNLGP